MIRTIGAVAILTFCALHAAADELPANNAAGAEFFERSIRPILVEKCQSCHGGKKIRGGLALTGRAAILKGGESGPAIVVGKPDASRLIAAIEYRDERKMPPTGKLSDSQILAIRQWVALGAPWPDTAAAVNATGGPFLVSEEQARWWAYQPVRAVTPPEVRDVAAVQSEIDRFVVAALELRSLTQTAIGRNDVGRVSRPVRTALESRPTSLFPKALSAPAEKRTLLRRVTFDLTGLPPTPDEVERFLADRRPDAFAQVVDRLLASPSYGQRWARHWLDVVRYADYHDANPKARTASCEPLEAWRFRDWVVDALNRDLPFDQFIIHHIAGDLLPPPPGMEFNADGLVASTFLSNGVWDRGDADKEKIVSDMVDDQIDTVGKAFMGLTLGCARCHDHKFDPVSQEDYYGLAGIFYSTHVLKELGAKGGEYTLNRTPLAPAAVVAKREQWEKELADVQKKLADLDKRKPPAAPDDSLRRQLMTRRDQLEKETPPPIPLAMAAQEGGTPGGLFPKIQDVPLHIRGSYTRLGPVIARRLPRFFAGEGQMTNRQASGRMDLARWVASAANPLTARVIVNRIWQHHFGEGLVRTPNNFGKQGAAPTHPELLDWLAATFVEDGWSLKKLHRRMLLSAVYQQSSRASAQASRLDPDDRWLARMSARRLEAEAIRDATLYVAGRLDLAVGGPAADDLTTSRRSLYVQTARWDRGNYAMLFDAANPDTSVEKRTVTTVAPQALFLLNHPFLQEQARHLARRLREQPADDDAARIAYAYRLLLSRDPRPDEVRIGQAFLGRAGRNDVETAWTEYAHLLLCSNEFVYVD